ncbi:MAG: L-lactate dehydrogenase [Verrucomicrobiota bacterium]
MKRAKKKIALIGTGFVGMSYAYSLLNQGVGDELVLIDMNRDKAEGEAMDLNHGLPFAPSSMLIKAGDFSDCEDADLVVVTAGAAQKEGQSRLDLLKINAGIMRSITRDVIASGFDGIFLIATNPVDILTQVVLDESKWPKSRVFGSGCTLDTARLRHELAKRINVDSRNIHGFVLGEHGDSEFVAWSKVTVSVKPIADVIDESPDISWEDLDEIHAKVRDAAYEIINRKNATYYAIGIALVRITKAVLNDENLILPVSSLVENEYPEACGICIGLPAKVNRQGVASILSLKLSEQERVKLANSANILRESLASIGLTTG